MRQRRVVRTEAEPPVAAAPRLDVQVPLAHADAPGQRTGAPVGDEDAVDPTDVRDAAAEVQRRFGEVLTRLAQ